jgi:hypothetical protein
MVHVALLFLLAIAGSQALAQTPTYYPSWWSSYGVLSGTTRADYAAANQGQAKNIAFAAIQEFSAALPGGAGETLDALALTLSATSANTRDYAAINLGQLKALAKPFYDRLAQDNFSGPPLTLGQMYPWLGSGNSPEDYAAANIGQVKNLFSFTIIPTFGLTVNPSTATVLVNGNQSFSVYGVDQYGDPLDLSDAVWTVSGGGWMIGAGSNSMFLSNGTAGTYTVTATSTNANASANSTVTVYAPVATSFLITPNPAPTVASGNEYFFASLKDQYGYGMDLSGLVWTVSGGGTVSGSGPEGYFTSNGTTGTYIITATLGSLVTTATAIVYTPAVSRLSVSPTNSELAASGSETFYASASDQYRGWMDPSNTRWTVSGGGSITGTGASAVFSSNGTAGTYTVTGTLGAAGTTTSVTVYDPIPTQFYIYPSSTVCVASGSTSFWFYAYDQNWQGMDTSGATWSVSGGGSMSGTGSSSTFVSSGTVGNFTVTASLGAVSGTAAVDVQLSALQSLYIEPSLSPVVIAPGSTEQLSAQGYDQFWNLINPVSATWSVIGGGSISGSGLFTSNGTPGAYIVTAVSGTVQANETINVEDPTLCNLYVTPTYPEILANTQQQFSITGTDQFGNTVIFSNPTWYVSGGGTIANGIFTSNGAPGDYTVVGTVGSTSVAGGVDVVPAASISVSPSIATVVPGSEEQFCATGTDGYGNSYVLNNVTWSVNGGGTIDSTGLFTATGTSGSYTVTATSGTLTATGTINLDYPVTALSILPNPAPTLLTDTEQQFTAVATNQYGGLYQPSNVTWSLASGLGSVSGSGVYLTGGTNGSYTYTIEATSGTVNATTNGTVYSAETGSGVLLPDPAVLPADTVQPLVYYFENSSGQLTPSDTDWADDGWYCNGDGYLWQVGTSGTEDYSPNDESGTFGIWGYNNVDANLTTTAIVLTEGGTLAIPPAVQERPANWQGQLTAMYVDTSGSVWTPTNVIWSGTGVGTINSNGNVTLDGTTGTFTVHAGLSGPGGSSTAYQAQATIYAYSTTVSSNGDGISDWQNAQLGISSTNTYINGDGYTNAQNIAMGINPFMPYTFPTDSGTDTTAPTVYVTFPPPGAVLSP